MRRVRTDHIYLHILLITCVLPHVHGNRGVFVHFTKICVLCYVDNIILSKIEWFVNWEFVLTKFNICVFLFYIAYFPSRLQNKDLIRKEIKQRHNIIDCFVYGSFYKVMLSHLCIRFYKGCCPGSLWNTETQQCESKKTAI